MNPLRFLCVLGIHKWGQQYGGSCNRCGIYRHGWPRGGSYRSFTSRHWDVIKATEAGDDRAVRRFVWLYGDNRLQVDDYVECCGIALRANRPRIAQLFMIALLPHKQEAAARACKTKEVEVVSLLLKNGLDPNLQWTSTALKDDWETEYTVTLSLLHNALRSESGIPYSHWGAPYFERDRERVSRTKRLVTLLIDAGARPDASDSEQIKLLMA